MSGSSDLRQGQGSGHTLGSRGGHEYGSTSIDGRARVQQGDTITVNYYNDDRSSDSPEQRKFRKLVGSLAFDRMDARMRNVAHALPSTSQWLFHHAAFSEWLDANLATVHHGFFWLKGKPGSGKSTIMKELLSWFAKTHSCEVQLSFFFNARSADVLDKSSLGMYRSLVHQLVSNPAHQNAHTAFFSQFATKERNGKVDEWQEIELKNFIFELVSRGDLPIVNIFIDALDEGEQDDIRQMVEFLEDLARLSTLRQITLRICLSSRHYPNISVEKSVSVVVEDQVAHENDIDLYIKAKLRTGQNTRYSGLHAELLRKSSHVFLWVVLVIPILNQVHDRGRGMSAMLAKLESIPQNLNDLFSDILNRGEEDSDECIIILQWVLHSLRPLACTELYEAIRLVQDTSRAGQIRCQDTDNVVSVQQYLLDCSRGLVETAKTMTGIMTVQFIHETVRHYLTTQKVFDRWQPNLEYLVFSGSFFQAEECHMKMTINCLQYLFKCISEHLNSIVGHGVDRSLFNKNNPLSDYAATFWWQHAQHTASSHRNDIIKLALPFLTDKFRLCIWLKLCTGCSEAPYKLSPLFYAVLMRLPEIVKALLHKETNINTLHMAELETLQCFCQASSKDVQQKISMDRNRGAYEHEKNRATLLQAASFIGDAEIAEILLHHGADVNVEGGAVGSALKAAVKMGHEEIVRSLLLAGAGTDSIEISRTSALQIATQFGYENIVRLLIRSGAFINNTSGSSLSPLKIAVSNGDERLVSALIQDGADVNLRGAHSRSALWIAVTRGYDAIVKMLIGAGANEQELWNSKNSHNNVLYLSLAHKQVALILLQRMPWTIRNSFVGNTFKILSRCYYENEKEIVYFRRLLYWLPLEVSDFAKSTEAGFEVCWMNGLWGKYWDETTTKYEIVDRCEFDEMLETYAELLRTKEHPSAINHEWNDSKDIPTKDSSDPADRTASYLCKMFRKSP